MSETKFTAGAAYVRCIREVDRLIRDSEDLSLDEITVESLRTAIHALQTVPELYEALENARDYVATALHEERQKFADCEHASSYIASIEADLSTLDAALAKARGEA